MKERFATARAGELQQYKKAQRLLHKFNLFHPIDRKAPQAEKAQFEQAIEALHSEAEAQQSELDELKTVRYRVHKLIPDALPQSSLYERMKSDQNKCDLINLMDQSVKYIIVLQNNT